MNPYSHFLALAVSPFLFQSQYSVTRPNHLLTNPSKAAEKVGPNLFVILHENPPAHSANGPALLSPRPYLVATPTTLAPDHSLWFYLSLESYAMAPSLFRLQYSSRSFIAGRFILHPMTV